MEEEQRMIFDEYISFFGNLKREKTSLCLEFEKEKCQRSLPEIYSFLKNPPFIEDLVPFREEYISTIREIQKIVKEKVNFEIILTETDGAPYEQRFNTNFNSVLSEFENWGLDYLEHIRFFDTGHFWVTVEQARFRGSNTINNNHLLEEIKEYQANLFLKYKPIAAFYNYFFEYNDQLSTLINISLLFSDITPLREEVQRVSDIERFRQADNYLVRKGSISPSMVSGLVCKLEDSLNLVKYHPGD